MKRFSMAMTWLALAGLMTTVSCRKPVVGFTNGEARTVTVSAATESGNGSRTAVEGLRVTWSEGDEIKMNAGSVLTLEDECAGSTMGRFTGEVTGDGPYLIGYPAGATTYEGTTLKLNIPATMTYDAAKQTVPMVAYVVKADDDVQFRNAVNMLKLQLKGDDTEASKLTSIVLTSTTSNLSGDINVTFNGGVPEFAAIADADRAGKTTMTVSFGEEGLQLKADEVQCVYIPLAKINGGDLTVRFNCVKGSMEKKLTATEGFSDVNNMLSAPELMMGHEYVDLGLPSKILWATCNVGADKPEDYGDYFAWGETETKDYYDWSTYKWGDWNALTKYCTDSYYGPVDNKTVLDLEDDAARANWGGAWRMPTSAEWKELIDNTYMEWVYGYAGGDVNGFVVYKAKDEADRGLKRINGYGGWEIVDKSWKEASLKGEYSLSDAHLFLPTADFYDYYWSTSLLSSDSDYAIIMLLNSSSVALEHNARFIGYTVRAVR